MHTVMSVHSIPNQLLRNKRKVMISNGLGFVNDTLLTTFRIFYMRACT